MKESTSIFPIHISIFNVIVLLIVVLPTCVVNHETGVVDDDYYIGKHAHVLPINEGISANELVQLSLQIIPILSDKFKFPPAVRSATDIMKQSQCQQSLDWNNKKARRGCYVSIYVCDTEFSGRCFWSFWRQCNCPKFWVFKIYECHITSFQVPLPPESLHDSVNVPIGECILAVWIWVVSIAAAIPLLWYIIFRGVRIAYRKIY